MASIVEAVRYVSDGFARHRLLTYASAIAYQVVSSLIPFSCLALALLALVHAESLWTDHMAPAVLHHSSREVYALLDTTVRQVFDQKQVFWVSSGLVLALWEVSGAMRATTEALDEIYGVHEHRSRGERYAVSFLLAAVVGLLMISALALVLIGPALGGGGLLLGVLRYVGAGVLLALAVGLTLRLAPSSRQPVHWIGLGSLVIVIGWLTVVGSYVFYASSIASYSSIFGGLAVVFLLVVAVYMCTVVFLVGVLADASVRGQRRA